MTITIHEFDKETDSEYFNKLSFETLVSMKGIPPGMTRSEFYNEMVPMVNEYMKILDQNCIKVAKSENSEYRGHIWFSLTEELEPWHFSPYYWLQNITILQNFRHSGIGTFLMQYLEKVIQNKNSTIKKIGLHVDAENLPALRLYDKMGYSTYKTQLFYKITQNSISINSKYQVSCASTEREYKEIIGLALYFYGNKLPLDKSFNQLQKNLEDCFFKIKKTKSCFTYSLKNGNEEVQGFFTLQESEMKYQKTIYISQFGFNSRTDFDSLVDTMLNFAENWAIERNVEFIETVVYNENNDILDYFKQKGFKEFGYFKQKMIE
jgi:GNAT superfamily N-acetyltransferase